MPDHWIKISETEEEERRKASGLTTALPEAAPASIAAAARPESALAAAAIPGAILRTFRFGVTFDVPGQVEEVVSLINSIGGRDVKFKEFPKE